MHADHLGFSSGKISEWGYNMKVSTIELLWHYGPYSFKYISEFAEFNSVKCKGFSIRDHA